MVLGGPGSYFWQGRCDRTTRFQTACSWFNNLYVLTSGQVIAADKENIVKTYYPGFFMQSVDGQIQTKQVDARHDDSYQGETPSEWSNASW